MMMHPRRYFRQSIPSSIASVFSFMECKLSGTKRPHVQSPLIVSSRIYWICVCPPKCTLIRFIPRLGVEKPLKSSLNWDCTVQYLDGSLNFHFPLGLAWAIYLGSRRVWWQITVTERIPTEGNLWRPVSRCGPWFYQAALTRPRAWPGKQSGTPKFRNWRVWGSCSTPDLSSQASSRTWPIWERVNKE
jgi:hypothetical protein